MEANMGGNQNPVNRNTTLPADLVSTQTLLFVHLNVKRASWSVLTLQIHYCHMYVINFSAQVGMLPLKMKNAGASTSLVIVLACGSVIVIIVAILAIKWRAVEQCYQV